MRVEVVQEREERSSALAVHPVEERGAHLGRVLADHPASAHVPAREPRADPPREPGTVHDDGRTQPVILVMRETAGQAGSARGIAEVRHEAGRRVPLRRQRFGDRRVAPVERRVPVRVVFLWLPPREGGRVRRQRPR